MTVEPDGVEREIYIAARPETIFPFFTDPAKMTLWSGRMATLDARPGGIYRVDTNGEWIERGEYVEVTPFERIVFTFGWEGEGMPLAPGSTRVEVHFIPDGEGTLVRLCHTGLPADQRESHGEGWAHFLPRLKAAAEGRDPGLDPWLDPAAEAQADSSSVMTP